MTTKHFLDDAPPAVRDLMISMWADIEQSSRKNEAKRAKDDPVSNRLTRVFDPGARMAWRYYDAGKDGRGRKVRFAWATTRNVAGYFLGWRQVINKDGSGKRDQWTASRTRGTVKATAKRRTDAFRAKQEASR